jgi:hypothetical protein
VVAENKNYHRLVDPIRSNAASFLLREKKKNWSFNYWARGAKERESMPYPDDIDDTFNALAALMRYDHTIIDGEALAAIVAILTSVEAQEGGPYRTWLVATPNSKWADVDLAANSTVGYFLALAGVHLPHLESLIGNAIAAGALRSPYYPSAAQMLYFISRFYKNHRDHTVTQSAVTAVVAFRKANAAQMTPLESAITITALINLSAGEVVHRNEVEELLIKERQEGWKPYAFCIDPARAGATSYAGASALTAALCLEMAVLYNDVHTRRGGEPAKKDSTQQHKRVIARAKSDLDQPGIDPALKAIIERKIDATADGKITLLAHDFKNALGARGTRIQYEAEDRLALGNIYGWIAYDIYDDFLDDEGDPLLLGAANICLRALTHVYEAEELTIPGCLSLFNRIVNGMDSANVWEQSHCRLPAGKNDRLPAELPDFADYLALADRSLGHAMGPLVELMIAGYGPESPAFQNILAMFRHYLIARQLHDDAHDWADDLLRGRVNSVGALVVKSFQTRHADKKRTGINETLPFLREIFWKETIDKAATLIYQHARGARGAREKSGVINGTDFLEAALMALEDGAKKAIAERDDALLFLTHYHPVER